MGRRVGAAIVSVVLFCCILQYGKEIGAGRPIKTDSDDSLVAAVKRGICEEVVAPIFHSSAPVGLVFEEDAMQPARLTFQLHPQHCRHKQHQQLLSFKNKTSRVVGAAVLAGMPTHLSPLATSSNSFKRKHRLFGVSLVMLQLCRLEKSRGEDSRKYPIQMPKPPLLHDRDSHLIS